MATITHLPAGLRTARLIATSMILGVTMFAVVAWFVVQDRAGPAVPMNATILLYAWVAIAFAAGVTAIILWRINVAPKIERPIGSAQDDASREQALVTALVINWALIEGPALFAIVIYFLSGATLALAAGLLMVWIGIGLTFPRAPWFPAAQRRP